jgi:hypothetical protein
LKDTILYKMISSSSLAIIVITFAASFLIPSSQAAATFKVAKGDYGCWKNQCWTWCQGGNGWCYTPLDCDGYDIRGNASTCSEMVYCQTPEVCHLNSDDENEDEETSTTTTTTTTTTSAPATSTFIVSKGDYGCWKNQCWTWCQGGNGWCYTSRDCDGYDIRGNKSTCSEKVKCQKPKVCYLNPAVGDDETTTTISSNDNFLDN